MAFFPGQGAMSWLIVLCPSLLACLDIFLPLRLENKSQCLHGAFPLHICQKHPLPPALLESDFAYITNLTFRIELLLSFLRLLLVYSTVCDGHLFSK